MITFYIIFLIHIYNIYIIFNNDIKYNNIFVINKNHFI